MAENHPRIISSEHALQNDLDRGDDGVLDTQSEASSAGGLQMSMLENRLENEMTKLATMVKNTVGSLQCTITSLSEQFEKKIAEVDQRLNSLDADRDVYANQNVNRSSSLFDRLHHSSSNSDGVTQGTSSYQCRGDNLPSLITPSNQNSISTRINLTKDQGFSSQCKGGNPSGDIAQMSQSCSNSNMEKSNEQVTQSKGSNNHFKMRPQNFDGGSDFDEFWCVFEITCEINAWKYKEKSL